MNSWIVDAKTEAEKSKKNRDWALGERDKIVQEREGIRSLCESLRHQRDRAVSDKAQALRDYDNIKKEKMEACKELKEVRCVSLGQSSCIVIHLVMYRLCSSYGSQKNL